MGDSIIKEKKIQIISILFSLKNKTKKLTLELCIFLIIMKFEKKLILKRIGKYFNSHIEFYFLKKLKK